LSPLFYNLNVTGKYRWIFTEISWVLSIYRSREVNYEIEKNYGNI
jgi:hypothetical protein